MAAATSVIELADRLSGRVIVSSDISGFDIENLDAESLIAHVIEHFSSHEGAKVLDKKTLEAIVSRIKEEKKPVQVEIVRPSNFKSEARELDSLYSVRCPKIERSTSTTSDFIEYFRDRFSKLRSIICTFSNSYGGTVSSIEAIKGYIAGRELGAIGIIYDKITTKNGHILVTLEDESGTAKVLFLKPMRKAKDPSNELFDAAIRLVKDDVVYVKGKVSGPFVMASKLMWPEVPIRTRTKQEEDISIAFMSDVHVGSKFFLEKQFGKFLDWINGGLDNRKDLASKVKYLVIAGDAVDGVGVYPEQEKELNIDDIFKQYSVFFDYIKSVPDYIEVFVMPGNHDAVQLAEPQPPLGKDLVGEDFNDGNVHIVSNPCYLNLHGVKVLSYHGKSLDSIIRNIQGCTYANASEAMKELLKRRHLSPIYGENVIIPSKSDSLVIDEVPGHPAHGAHTQERL